MTRVLALALNPTPALPLPPQVAGMCAHNVVNTNVPCCGMAGDRGMRYPELTGASLQVGSGSCFVSCTACMSAGPAVLREGSMLQPAHSQHALPAPPCST